MLRETDEYRGRVIERRQVSFGDTAEERILTLGFVNQSAHKQAAYNQPQQGCHQESLPERKSPGEADQTGFDLGPGNGSFFIVLAPAYVIAATPREIETASALRSNSGVGMQTP